MVDKLFLSIPKSEIEQGALNQIDAVMKLDFLKYLAIMPDVHQGYALPIGGVALLDNHISPSFVGYDIGCGVSHINTGIVIDPNDKDYDEWRKYIFDAVYASIPLGFSGHKKKVDGGAEFTEFKSASGDKELDKSVNDIMLYQLGTLGGGNHFIEFGLNSKNELGVTIHSGSRKAGHLVCSYYTRPQERMYSTDAATVSFGPEKSVIFSADSERGKAYIADMEFCLSYALENRKRMMEYILGYIIQVNTPAKDFNTVSKKVGLINKNHNHAIRTPDGWLHRKGAISAAKGEIGVIPGNMRDGVYITEGLGNDEWLDSASHGAGRKLSRSAADKTLTLYKFEQEMGGIVAKVSESTLDESPMAYKDFDAVIKAQESKTIKILDKFMPIINIKADDKNSWRKKK